MGSQFRSHNRFLPFFSKMFYSLTFENIPLIKVLVKIMIQILNLLQ